MEAARGKIVRKGTDGKGRPRKFIEIGELYYDDFEFGDIVRIEKIQNNELEQKA